MTACIASSDVDEHLRHISISGRLDIPGTESVVTELSALCGSTQHRVVLDLTAVGFISSIGIRALVASAKTQLQFGGKMAVVADRGSSVARILETTGIDLIIPLFFSVAEADKAVRG